MRHGHTALNALRELHGHIDDSLDEEGRAEAAALGALFTGIALTAVYASPLQRAIQTAAPVAARAGLDIVADDGLMDRDYGPWTGQQKKDVVREFGGVDHAPGVEPWEQFGARVHAAFVTLTDRHATDAIAVVAHDAVNQALLARLFPTRWVVPTDIEQRNGCWNRLERRGGMWELAVFDAVPGDGQWP